MSARRARLTALCSAITMAASSVGVVAPAPALAEVGADGLGIDQAIDAECSVEDLPGGTMLNPGDGFGGLLGGTAEGSLTAAWQTFTPSVGSVAALDLCLTPVLGDVGGVMALADRATHQVNIYAVDGTPDDPEHGLVTATTAELSLLGTEADLLMEGAAWFRVLPENALLVPGAQYAIELADPSVEFVWRATCGGDVPGAPACEPVDGPDGGSRDAYARGSSPQLPNADDTGYGDHGFRTWFHDGADLVADVDVPALVCPDLRSLAGAAVVVSNVGTIATQAFDAELLIVDGAGERSLGTASIRGLYGTAAGASSFDSVTIPALAFDLVADAEALLAGADGPVTLRAVVDGADVVAEADDDNNVTDATTTRVPCATGALSNPRLVAVDGDGSPVTTIEHGFTALPFAALTPADIAEGGAGFNRTSTYVAADVASPEDSPLWASPLWASPLWASPVHESPLWASPLWASPLWASPLWASPLWASPLWASPLWASPLWASSLDSVLASVDDEFLAMVSIASVPVDPSWTELLENHIATYPNDTRAPVLLELPEQDVTLLDVLSLEPALGTTPQDQLGLTLSDVDLSRVLALTPLSLGLANTPLSAYPYAGDIAGPCDVIELDGQSSLTCDDLTARGYDVASLTMMQLGMLGYAAASFPLIDQPLAEVARPVDPSTGATGNLLFDLPLAFDDLRPAGEDVVQGHYRVQFTALGRERIATAVHDPAAVLDCDAVDCQSATLADAEAAYAFAYDTTLADLLDALSPDAAATFSIGDALAGLQSMQGLPWGSFDADPVDTAAIQADECPVVPFVMTLDNASAAPVNEATVSYRLPEGWDLVESSLSAVVDGEARGVIAIEELEDETTQTTRVWLTVEGLIHDSIEVTAGACASDHLGSWTATFLNAEWGTIVFDEDGPSAGRVNLLDTGEEVSSDQFAAAVTVVEALEPDQGRDRGDRVIAPDTLIRRHIATGEDVDQFVIPVGEPIPGTDVTIEEGDFVSVHLAPPKGQIVAVGEDGQPVIEGGADLDLALFTSLGVPENNVLLLSEQGYGIDDAEAAIAPLDDPGMVVGDSTSSLEPSSLSASPLWASPLWASPLWASDVDASPLWASPLWASPLWASPLWASPAQSVSNQRGDRYEQVFTQIRQGAVLEPGNTLDDLTIQVSGYLGAADDEPYSLWYLVHKAQQNALACTPPNTITMADVDPDVVAGGLPSVAPGTRTLVFFNEALVSATYPQADVEALKDQLGAFVASPLVDGVIVDPMASAGYRDAMLHHLSTPDWCEPLSANDVHGEARRIVLDLAGQTRGSDGSRTLEYVIAIGGDDIQPFARLRDVTTQSNEREHLMSILRDTGTLNPLSAAHAQSFLLSDDPWVTTNPRLWGDDFVWLPDFVSSRLYGTPAQVARQLSDFLASDGVVVVDDALVTGEAFLTDGAQRAADNFEIAGLAVDRSLINPVDAAPEQLTTIDALLAALGAGPDLTILYEHADQTALASPFASATKSDDLLRTSRVTAEGITFGHVVAGTVCHFGENIPASYTAAAPGEAPVTWTDALAASPATSFTVAHTSYGFGVSPGVDLSESLLDTMTRLGVEGQLSWGEAVRQAKQQYFLTRSEYGEHQRKVLMTLVNSGIPMVRTHVDAPSLASRVIDTASVVNQPELLVDPASGLDVFLYEPPTLAASDGPCLACLRRVDVPEGTYYTAVTSDAVGGASGVEGRPIVPTTTMIYDVGDREVGGVLITDITSELADGSGGDTGRVDFASASTRTTPSSGSDIEALDVEHGGVQPNVRVQDGRAHITSARAAARGEQVESDGRVTGTYRLDTAAEGFVYLRAPGAPEQQAPQIGEELTVLRDAVDRDVLEVTFQSTDQSDMVRASVGVLIAEQWYFDEPQRVTATTWSNPVGDQFTTKRWTTTLSIPGVGRPEAILISVVDEYGAVATTKRKGLPMDADEGEVGDVSQPQLTIVPLGEGGGLEVDLEEIIYDEGVQVVVDGVAGVAYLIEVDGELHYYASGSAFVVEGDGFHEVVALASGQVIRFGVDDADPQVRVRFLRGDQVILDDVVAYGGDGGNRVTTLVYPDEILAGEVIDVEVSVVDLTPTDVVLSGDVTPDPTSDTSPLPQVRERIRSAATVTTRLDTTSVGSGEMVLMATDAFGGVTSATYRFEVVSRFAALEGFFQPIKQTAPQTYSGRVTETVPFKFRVYDYFGQLSGDTTVMALWWTQVNRVGGGAIGEPCAAVSNPGYRFSGSVGDETLDDQHIFNAEPRCISTHDGTEVAFAAGEVWMFTAAVDGGAHALSAYVTYR